MLTERGWAALGATLALVVLWVALGEVELLVAAAVVAAALALALVVVRGARPRLEVRRQLVPPLAHEGEQAMVDVLVTNRSSRPLVNVTLRDRVGNLGTAEFQVGRIAGGETITATYQILCRPRGVYRVGPADVEVTDAVRLAAVSATAGGTDRLVVYPATEELTGFPSVRSQDPAMQASRPQFGRRGSEDFYTLREYQTGDDLRRVHWPSSAKRDELMIRQLETPWQSRALVLLDVRAEVYEDRDCFEHAVRGAASVFSHLARSGFDADIWAGGKGTVGSNQLMTAMERLAEVQPETGLDLGAAALAARFAARGGALFLVTGIPDHRLLTVYQLLAGDYRSVVVMPAAHAAPSSLVTFQRGGALTVTSAPGEAWAMAWMKTVRRTWAGVSAG
jgi:uncharacterized protein (DUF58 family)